MRTQTTKANTKVRASVVAGFFLVTVCSVLSLDHLTPTVVSQARRPSNAAARYSSFAHTSTAHKIECSACHKFPSSNWNRVRTGDAAFPDITEYPTHDSCIDCHRRQFFRGARPTICSICHTNAGPRNSTRHPFPNPREIFDASPKGKQAESDFEIGFSHEKHIEIVSARVPHRSVFRNVSLRSFRAEESCVVCHTTLKPQGTSDDEYLTKPPASIGDAFWLKKGTFKSVPTGHTTCFTCHSQDTGIEPAPENCATCHKLRQQLAERADFDPKLASQMGATERVMLDAWRRRDSSGTFRHEFSSHAELSCDTCHNVTAMDTVVRKTKIVPLSSCATCHVTATVDEGGALNYEVQERKSRSTFQCTKCHITLGKLPVPKSHVQAIIEAGGKP